MMAMEFDQGNWVPLVEFSVSRGISLSTLRRYIKSNKIPWKLIDGRYLVMDDGTIVAPRPVEEDGFSSLGKSRVKDLETELGAANEEITELKMLVAFYEERWAELSKK